MQATGGTLRQRMASPGSPRASPAAATRGSTAAHSSSTHRRGPPSSTPTTRTTPTKTPTSSSRMTGAVWVRVMSLRRRILLPSRISARLHISSQRKVDATDMSGLRTRLALPSVYQLCHLCDWHVWIMITREGGQMCIQSSMRLYDDFKHDAQARAASDQRRAPAQRGHLALEARPRRRRPPRRPHGCALYAHARGTSKFSIVTVIGWEDSNKLGSNLSVCDDVRNFA